MIVVQNSQTTPVLTILTIRTQPMDKRISSSQTTRVFKTTSRNFTLVGAITWTKMAVTISSTSKIEPISLLIGTSIGTWWIHYISQGKLLRHFKCINIQAFHGEEVQIKLTTSTLFISSKCKRTLRRIIISSTKARCRATKLGIQILTLLKLTVSSFCKIKTWNRVNLCLTQTSSRSLSRTLSIKTSW